MPTSTELPPTLQPIKRGAVIDWKATAIAEHDARWEHQIQSSNRRRVIADQAETIARLEERLKIAAKQAHDALDQLEAIRAHWSSIFLPTRLR